MLGGVIPRAPSGLDKPGRALWRAIWADLGPELELDARERELLRRACRTADELEQLEAAVDRDGVMSLGSEGQPVVNPAVREARQLRLTLARLLGQLDLGAAGTVRTQRARTAARARWLEEAS
jgi:P27 family predicted phage terminase small subunit